MNVDELVGEQRRVFVVEDGFQLARSGGGVDLVVGGEQIACSQLLCVVLVVGVHGQALFRRQLVQHLGKLVFGQCKVNRDRLELIDNNQVSCVGGDDIAGVHQAQANFAVDGRFEIGRAH